MSPKVEQFNSNETSAEKELTRKLYWAITSTISLTPEQKKTTFSWVCGFAEKLLERAAVSPPPATRSNGLRGKALAIERKRCYTAQAGGGVAGSSDQEPPRALPSERTTSRATHLTVVSPERLAAFRKQEAESKARAIAYLQSTR